MFAVLVFYRESKKLRNTAVGRVSMKLLFWRCLIFMWQYILLCGCSISSFFFSNYNLKLYDPSNKKVITSFSGEKMQILAQNHTFSFETFFHPLNAKFVDCIYRCDRSKGNPILTSNIFLKYFSWEKKKKVFCWNGLPISREVKNWYILNAFIYAEGVTILSK